MACICKTCQRQSLCWICTPDLEKDIPCQRYVEKGESLLCSEPVNFQTEWRAFVRYRIIWDVRSYRGNWHAHYGSNVLDNTIRAYTGTPAGYAMDFGLTEDGRTLLVEINDSFALGSYELVGLPGKVVPFGRLCGIGRTMPSVRFDWRDCARGASGRQCRA